MNYNQLDLNLLNVFNAVMTELNVTRAAQQLNMTQPAVSNALNRLRHVLGDELFIKVPTGVSPTPKALQIWQPIRDALAQIRQTLEPQTFDPATAIATLTIAMNDFIAALILPKLVTLLEQSAPRINVRTIPSTNINAPQLLDHAEIDLTIGVFATMGSRLRSQTLFVSPFVCAMRRGHPLSKKKLTLERYCQANHLLVTLTGEPSGFMEPLLQERGVTRRIALSVNQFSLAAQIVATSDLIAVLPVKAIDQFGLTDQLHLVPVPIEVAPSILKLLWHERNHAKPAQVWLRSRLADICTGL